MVKTVYGIATLLVVGCGGLATETGGDAAIDRSSISHVDSGPREDGTVHPNDATTDVHAQDAATDAHLHDARFDAYVCPGADAANQWSVSPTPSSDGGTAALLLRGVWGSAANDVWAVGNARLVGAIVHWDGSAWRQSPLRSADGGMMNFSYLTAVWGSGPSDVWATGSISSIPGTPLVHWDGSTWSTASLSSIDGGMNLDTLDGVWGSGSDDVWAVGDETLHWNGSAWSVSPLPSIEGGTIVLNGIWGSGPSDVWAVGGSAILHWDGTRWSASSSGRLNGVWGSGPSDVWGVGDEILHWNGTAWSSSPVAPPPPGPPGSYFSGSRFDSVWGSGPSDAWVVGEFLYSIPFSDSAFVPFIFHWDGATWTSAPLMSTDGGLVDDQLHGIWGSGPCDVWAVGGNTPTLGWGNGMILHHP